MRASEALRASIGPRTGSGSAGAPTAGKAATEAAAPAVRARRGAAGGGWEPRSCARLLAAKFGAINSGRVEEIYQRAARQVLPLDRINRQG